MIEEGRRLTATDATLVFLAALVLALTVGSRLDPTSGSDQIVYVRGEFGVVSQYRLPAKGARIHRVKYRLADAVLPQPHPLTGTNRWISETSRFYAADAPQRWAEKPSLPEIEQVSHTEGWQRHEHPVPIVTRSWASIADAADARIKMLDDHVVANIRDSRPPPVLLGAMVPRAPSKPLVLASLIVAFAVIATASTWCFMVPSLILVQKQPPPTIPEPEPETSGLKSAAGRPEPSLLALELSPHWIQLNQPASASMRRILASMLVIAAFVSLIAA